MAALRSFVALHARADELDCIKRLVNFLNLRKNMKKGLVAPVSARCFGRIALARGQRFQPLP